MRTALLAATTWILALGCMGGNKAPPAQEPPTSAEENTVELKEPWKSLNIPVAGAKVFQNSETLLSFTVQGDLDSLDMYVRPMLEGGWELGQADERPGSRRQRLKKPDGRYGSVTVAEAVDLIDVSYSVDPPL